MVVEDLFYVVVPMAKITDDPGEDLFHLIIRKLADTFENTARPISTSLKKRSRDDPAVVTDEPDGQTLDGKRGVLNHQ